MVRSHRIAVLELVTKIDRIIPSSGVWHALGVDHIIHMSKEGEDHRLEAYGSQIRDD
jgi:hypothetical protein